MLAWWLAEHHEDLTHGAEAAHDAAHGAEHGGGIPELPNIFGVVHHILAEKSPATADFLDNFVANVLKISDPMVTPFMAFENLLFAALTIIILAAFFYQGYRRLRKAPPRDGSLSRRALFSEIVVLFFDDFFGQLFGKKEARRHLPFVGTLFIYILAMNCFGLVFLGKSPTSNLSFNLGMATVVFFYVHITGISRSPVGYLKHYPGSLPTIKELGGMGFVLIPFMAILFTIIHVLEAIIQPVSLSLRLFGNILGKEVLLGVFGSLVLIGTASIGVYVPLHTPFLFLGLLLGAIQALIFSLLSAVYITLWLPHEHEPAEGH